ncbi:hypothetical protein TTRE_0000868001 [Trichuris trichiura]|uniref:Uncharacterized protein n=1 Tax=Trichuris trichiura TaxID=36087 RepID=A0A077ZKT2_TRITR|nr:hypothetical protein TTRE_0000868001 [Trichuris trichiura]
MAWLHMRKAYSLPYMCSRDVGVIVRAPSLPVSSSAASYDKGQLPRRRPAPYVPTFSDKCLHMSLRVRDSFRALKRYSLLWSIAGMAVLFFGSYTLYARWKYPDQPINLYQWRTLEKDDKLTPEMINKSKKLDAFVERRKQIGID